MDGNHHLVTEKKKRGERTRIIANLWLNLFAQRALATLIEYSEVRKKRRTQKSE